MSTTVSMRGEQSRSRILRSAETLVAERGFNAVTIQDILDAAKVTKGKFFHYFESKEHFFGELIRFALQNRPVPNFNEIAAECSSSDPFDRLLFLIERLIEFHRRGLPESMRLCVFATFFFSPTSPEMRRIATTLSRNMQCLEELFEQAKPHSGLPPQLTAEVLALMVPSLTVGGNIIGYIHHRRRLSAENLEMFREMLISFRRTGAQ